MLIAIILITYCRLKTFPKWSCCSVMRLHSMWTLPNTLDVLGYVGLCLMWEMFRLIQLHKAWHAGMQQPTKEPESNCIYTSSIHLELLVCTCVTEWKRACRSTAAVITCPLGSELRPPMHFTQLTTQSLDGKMSCPEKQKLLLTWI